MTPPLSSCCNAPLCRAAEADKIQTDGFYDACSECLEKFNPKPEEPTSASYSNITDEERRQTYDYKLGYREGMEEAKRIAEGCIENVNMFAGLGIPIDKKGREHPYDPGMLAVSTANTVIRSILSKIDQKLCQK